MSVITPGMDLGLKKVVGTRHGSRPKAGKTGNLGRQATAAD